MKKIERRIPDLKESSYEPASKMASELVLHESASELARRCLALWGRTQEIGFHAGRLAVGRKNEHSKSILTFDVSLKNRDSEIGDWEKAHDQITWFEKQKCNLKMVIYFLRALLRQENGIDLFLLYISLKKNDHDLTFNKLSDEISNYFLHFEWMIHGVI